MVKVNEELSPFLTKLIDLTKTTVKSIARWNSEGTVFIVINDEEFKKTLKKYFKGTKQTFIRQLHFYGFKKIDCAEGSWGFTQENGLFVRDNFALVKTIKRKKKIDPDSQRIATYAEVQSLRNQVQFCQEVIDELKDEILCLKKGIPSKKQFTCAPIEKPSGKRMRVLDSDFEALCSKVNFTDLPDNELLRLPSFSSAMDEDTDLENLSDIFVDLELEPLESKQLNRLPSYQQVLLSDKPNFSEAVDVVAEATQVKRADVSKIITFLTKLSVKEKPSSNLEAYGLGISDLLSGPRVQKVGAS